MLKGVMLSLFSSLLFGGVYFISTLLQPIEGNELFGWRTIVTLPFVLIAFILLKKQTEFVELLKRLKKEPHLIVVLSFNSLNMGSQMWLFLWAPTHDSAIEVSTGYLLMPLIMVLTGRWVFKEPMSSLKAMAVLLAAIGVFSKIWLTGAFSLETVFVCIGYPIYFAMRKAFNILHLSSFVIEMLLMLPVSIYFAAQLDSQWVLSVNPYAYYWLAVLGFIGGVAFIAYIMASQIVPINILGLLGYAEPFMMFIVSFIIGERLDESSYMLMACLSLAVILVITEGIIKGLRD